MRVRSHKERATAILYPSHFSTPAFFAPYSSFFVTPTLHLLQQLRCNPSLYLLLSLVYVSVIFSYLSSFPSLSCITSQDIYNGNEEYQVGAAGNSRCGENMLCFVFHFRSFSWYTEALRAEGRERGGESIREGRGERAKRW